MFKRGDLESLEFYEKHLGGSLDRWLPTTPAAEVVASVICKWSPELLATLLRFYKHRGDFVVDHMVFVSHMWRGRHSNRGAMAKMAKLLMLTVPGMPLPHEQLVSETPMESLVRVCHTARTTLDQAHLAVSNYIQFFNLPLTESFCAYLESREYNEIYQHLVAWDQERKGVPVVHDLNSFIEYDNIKLAQEIDSDISDFEDLEVRAREGANRLGRRRRLIAERFEQRFNAVDLDVFDFQPEPPVPVPDEDSEASLEF